MSKRKHCWHQTGIMYTSNPPQWDDKCCHCGKVRRVRGEFCFPPGHGPYVTPEQVRYIAEDVGPCEAPPA